MPTRNVVLTDRQAKLVERLVSSGRYQNASEVLREGLRLIEAKAEEDKAKLAALREAAQLGIADIDAGRYRDFDTFDDLKTYIEEISERPSKRARER
jgi:antitoxin ParD1/3/4